MSCINCGHEVIEQFCPNCGQRSSVKRITLKEGWLDFWSRIYGFDGMLPRTLKDLTLRPGEVARTYIEGNRIKYYGPVGYFFLMLTLYLLLLSVMDLDIKTFISQNQRLISPSNASSKMAITVLEIAAKNIKVIAFMIMPFNAIAARYFLFKKSGLNFIEHMVVPFYVLGHIYWLQIMSACVYKVFNILTPNNFIIIFIPLYFGYTYLNFIKYQPKWKVFLKGVGVYLGAHLILILFAIVITLIVIALLAFINPDALELIKPSAA